MTLDPWIRQIKAAADEHDIVQVVGTFLHQSGPAGAGLPRDCMPGEIEDGIDLRREAARVARRDCADRVGRAHAELYQQMLIVLGFAVDRLAMLETRGFVRSPRLAPHPFPQH
ncbi:MAG TPA: hypothetical protein VFK48_15015 [Usitatibacter sp.]|nr:hypothetical protein [Usitatibacter sp.]